VTIPAVLPKARPINPDDVLLPSNLEAERSTLGAALVSDTAADYISDKLQPEAYHRRAHQDIFRGIRTLRHAKTEVDFVTLKTELQRLGKLEEVGGPSYVAGLADGVPRATNVQYYAGILIDLQMKRALIDHAQQTAAHVVEGEHPATAIIADADRRLLDIRQVHVDGRMRSLKASAGELFADLEWRANNRGVLTGVPTGFKSINDMTLGLQRGDLIVIGARPSIGKTTLAINIAVNAAKDHGARVAVFSLEMRRRQLEYRILSQLSQVDLERIRAGILTEKDYGRIAHAMETMHGLRIEIDDRAGQTAIDIRSACRRLRGDGGLDLVVVDYAQLIPGSSGRRNPSRNEEMTDINNRVKELADELSVPVVYVSQLRRIDGRPKLDDLRESGSLEQVADIVMLLHRKNMKDNGPTECNFAKQRNGATGVVMLDVTRETTTFVDAPEGTEPEREPEKPRKPRKARGMPNA
jgi:replicative DNA helicase